MVRLRLPASLAALAAVLLLAGCTTPGEPEAAPATPAPSLGGPVQGAKPSKPAAPVVQLKPATITGSEESSTMFDNFTAYVRAVDGMPVEAGRAGWNKPLLLKAGLRHLSVAFIRGAFVAQLEVPVNARPEAAYQLKFATDAHLFGKNSYCEFWIEDTATGEKVLAPARVPLTKLDSGK